MRIEYFLFAILLIFNFWVIPKISLFRHSDLSEMETRILLTLKILVGISCAFYFGRISSNVDYLQYNAEGRIQYEQLLSNPILFFADFSIDIHAYGLGGLLDSKDSFWAYLRFNLIFKFIALLNLVTHGNFYLNTVIFSNIVFFGHMAFYRTFSNIYKGNKIKIVIACFCLPSLSLYTSCVHKDGIVFLCLGFTSYIFYKVLTSLSTINIKYIAILLASLITIFLFRNYVIIAIVPAMLTALICNLLPYKKRYVLAATYAVFFLLFFLSGLNQSFLNLPAAVVQRKADFAALGEASTNIPMNELSPTIRSFISNFPQALNHFFLRPYLWEFSRLSVMLTAIELLFYQLLFFAFIFYGKKRAMMANNFNIFGLGLVVNMALIIGYTIPNIGAIVRYRSIFWVFLICPLICNTDWKRMFSFHKPLG